MDNKSYTHMAQILCSKNGAQSLVCENSRQPICFTYKIVISQS